MLSYFDQFKNISKSKFVLFVQTLFTTKLFDVNTVLLFSSSFFFFFTVLMILYFNIMKLYVACLDVNFCCVLKQILKIDTLVSFMSFNQFYFSSHPAYSYSQPV